MLVDDVQVVEFVHVFSADVATVFAAFTDPKALSEWFRPSRDHQVVLAEAEARPGGRYAIEVRAPGGATHRVEGRYEEVVTNERLRMTWEWTKGAPADGIGTTLVTIDFRGAGNRTRVHLRHERFADRDTRDIHAAGWRGSFSLLSHEVSGVR